MTKLVIAASIFQSQVADLLPCNNYKKSQLTYALINSYSLLSGFDKLIELPAGSREDLLQFHAETYINAIMNEKNNVILPFDQDEELWNQLHQMASTWAANKGEQNKGQNGFTSRSELYSFFQKFASKSVLKYRKRSAWDALLDDEDEYDKAVNENIADLKQFNLEGDCPLFSYLPMYCQVITGATLMLTDHIVKEERTIAINWDGGRHHAFKRRASGFCYINDIVLLIQKLRKKGFERISYVDFDLHHGDGVERAYQFSSNVQTISVHMYETGFFPCTGSLDDSKKGKSVINIPLLHGLDDNFLTQLVDKIVIPSVQKHEPEALIIQCGGDGLIGDGYAEWQLTIKGLVKCITNVMKSFDNCSIILLGGGGYNETVMSRFYTYLTWEVLRTYGSTFPLDAPVEFDEDALIPEHEFIELYAEEHYKFWAYEQEGSLKRKNLKNNNNIEFINELQHYYDV